MKAILVIEMPSKCRDCQFYYQTHDEDDDYVIEFNCKDNPGIPHYLYIIPFNEFGQPGVMEVYEL